MHIRKEVAVARVADYNTRRGPAPARQANAVSRGEFRLLLWMNAFALTAILGGMTVLYTGITDLRVAMEAQRAEILDVVRSEISGLRTEIADLRERVVRIETRLDTIIPPPVKSG